MCHQFVYNFVCDCLFLPSSAQWHLREWCDKNQRGTAGKQQSKCSPVTDFSVVHDATDAFGSPQQGALQQRPISAAWTGSASRAAASPHALLLSTRLVLHHTQTCRHKHTVLKCRLQFRPPGGSKQQQFGVDHCWWRMHRLSEQPV